MMEYYRSNVAGGIAQPNLSDACTTVSVNDSFSTNYWNIPYSDTGLSPMKQIEGKFVIQNIPICFHKSTFIFLSAVPVHQNYVITP